MNADLDALIKLQETRNRIAALTLRIEIEIPARIAEVETELRGLRQQVEAEQYSIQEAQKERMRLEMEMKGMEDRISKSKAALMQVKTNDEYRAALNEIDYGTRAQSEMETSILDLMEANEARRAALKELEQQFKIEDQKIHTDRKAMEEERNRLIIAREREERLAADLEAAIPSNLGRLYHRIAAVRGGVALARVENSVCGGCNMRMRPAVYQQVKRNEEVLTCDSCKRILYYVESEGGAAPEETIEPTPANEGTGQGLH